MSLLVEDWVSRASALQRKGRAGRVRAGVCWGMYTRHRFEHRMRRYQVTPRFLLTPTHLHKCLVWHIQEGRHGSQMFYPLHPLHHTVHAKLQFGMFPCCIGPNVDVQNIYAHAFGDSIIPTSSSHRCSRSGRLIPLGFVQGFALHC